MQKEVIHTGGEDVVVREDTAKAFRWVRFETIVLSGIVLIFIVAMLFFSGIFSAVSPDLNRNASTPVSNAQPGP